MIVKYSGPHRHAKLPLTPANMDAFKGETSFRINQSKLLSLAFIMFAADHHNQLPKNFAQVKPYFNGKGLEDSYWEIVSGGNRNSFSNPGNTILLRKKESRQSPDGKFVRIYAFADGHVEVNSSPDDDFAALEKERSYLAYPARN